MSVLNYIPGLIVCLNQPTSFLRQAPILNILRMRACVSRHPFCLFFILHEVWDFRCNHGTPSRSATAMLMLPSLWSHTVSLLTGKWTRKTSPSFLCFYCLLYTTCTYPKRDKAVRCMGVRQNWYLRTINGPHLPLWRHALMFYKVTDCTGCVATKLMCILTNNQRTIFPVVGMPWLDIGELC